MKLLITGVSSPLGLIVAELAKKEGCYVVGTVKASRLPFFSCFVDEVISLNLEDAFSFNNINKQFDAIIHVAGLSYGSPLELLQVTALGTLYLLNRAELLGIRSLIHVSGISVYGQHPEGIVSALTPIQHTTPYGVAKWAAESYLCNASKTVKCISVRSPAILAKVYAPHLLGRIVGLMQKNQPIVVSNPNFLFNNFVTVNKLASFLIGLAKDTPDKYSAFPVCSTEPLELVNITKILAKNLNYTREIEWTKAKYKPFSIDCSEAIKYGFNPEPVYEGIDWWLKELI